MTDINNLARMARRGDAPNAPDGQLSVVGNRQLLRGVIEHVRESGTGGTSGQYINVKDAPYNAVGDGVTDDTQAIQAAIDAAASNGHGSVVFIPNGDYKISRQGYVDIDASDDGTGSTQAYDGSTTTDIAAEAVNQQGYALKVSEAAAGVVIRGESRVATKLVCDWDRSTCDLDQTIAIAYDVGTWLSYVGVSDLSIEDAFIGIGQVSGTRGLNESQFARIRFFDCGICILTKALERTRFTDMLFFSCVAGHVSGGFWSQRADNYNDDGGWADKVVWDGITFQSGKPMTDTVFGALDTYFDTYFFKESNNTTRKYPSGGAGTPATACAYRGVAGYAIAALSRYFRPQQGCSMHAIRHMFSSRPALYLGAANTLVLDCLYIEGCGYANGQTSGDVIGDGVVDDPYNSGRYDNMVAQYAGITSGVTQTWTGLEVQFGAAKKPIPRQDGISPMNGRVAWFDATEGWSFNRSMGRGFEDWTPETIKVSKTWESDQEIGGNWFGTRLFEGYEPKTDAYARALVTLPNAGVWLVTARVSPNGDIANQMVESYIMVYYNSGYPQWHTLHIKDLYERVDGGGPIVPAGVDAENLDEDGQFTVRVNTNGQPQMYFRVDAQRIA